MKGFSTSDEYSLSQRVLSNFAQEMFKHLGEDASRPPTDQQFSSHLVLCPSTDVSHPT